MLSYCPHGGKACSLRTGIQMQACSPGRGRIQSCHQQKIIHWLQLERSTETRLRTGEEHGGKEPHFLYCALEVGNQTNRIENSMDEFNHALSKWDRKSAQGKRVRRKRPGASTEPVKSEGEDGRPQENQAGHTRTGCRRSVMNLGTESGPRSRC